MMRKEKADDRRSEQKQLSVGMKRLLTGYRTLLEADLEQEGITLAQLRMLNALGEQKEMSAAELARKCFITPQSMQAVVTRAERAGWIAREASSGNRRVLTATLTRSGRAALHRGLALSERIEQHLWGKAKSSELRAMNKTLESALGRLQECMDRYHADQHSAPHSAGARRRKTA